MNSINKSKETENESQNKTNESIFYGRKNSIVNDDRLMSVISLYATKYPSRMSKSLNQSKVNPNFNAKQPENADIHHLTSDKSEIKSSE